MTFGQGKQPVRRRGPYGTNEGDTWLMGDYFNDRIKKEKGPQWRMCVSLVRNPKTGVLEERMYSTENPELVREAEEGHEKYVAAQAAMN